MENEIFEAIFLCYKCNSKATKISPNQYVGLHGFLFTENSLKIKKGLELASRLYFLYNFLIKNFIFTFISKFHYQTVFTYQVIQQNVFRVSCISIWWRHDICISENLKFDYLKNEKSFRSEIKSIFPCFTTAQNKLAKM